MGFKENLKAELGYSGMLVKELSAKTGIKKHTLDNYLNTHNAIPSAESAVRIAQALGVTVEYLVLGQEVRDKTVSSLKPDLLSIVQTAEQLNPKNRRTALALLKALKKEQDSVK
jgi:transcriptional regulator with XRE-family HTH domain